MAQVAYAFKTDSVADDDTLVVVDSVVLSSQKTAPVIRENVKRSAFVPQAGTNTDASSSQISSVIAGSLAGSRVATVNAASDRGRKSVDAVVYRIMPDFVVIHALLPSGQLELTLPAGLVSEDLRQYGTPVSVSLDIDGGFKRPKITRREVAVRAELQNQQEIDRWVDTL